MKLLPRLSLGLLSLLPVLASAVMVQVTLPIAPTDAGNYGFRGNVGFSVNPGHNRADTGIAVGRLGSPVLGVNQFQGNFFFFSIPTFNPFAEYVSAELVVNGGGINTGASNRTYTLRSAVTGDGTIVGDISAAILNFDGDSGTIGGVVSLLYYNALQLLPQLTTTNINNSLANTDISIPLPSSFESIFWDNQGAELYLFGFLNTSGLSNNQLAFNGSDIGDVRLLLTILTPGGGGPSADQQRVARANRVANQRNQINLANIAAAAAERSKAALKAAQQRSN